MFDMMSGYIIITIMTILGHYHRLKSDSDVSLLNYMTILGHECIVIVYVGWILSLLITYTYFLPSVNVYRLIGCAIIISDVLSLDLVL